MIRCVHDEAAGGAVVAGSAAVVVVAEQPAAAAAVAVDLAASPTVGVAAVAAAGHWRRPLREVKSDTAKVSGCSRWSSRHSGAN